MNIKFFSIITFLSFFSINAQGPSYKERRREYEKIDPMTVRLGDLADGFCIPCHGGIKPLKVEEQEKLLLQVDKWKIDRSGQQHKLIREIYFSSFSEMLKFINAIVPVAQREKHHPDIFFSYNKLKLELHTHAIKGLSLNDYVLAAKINKVKPSYVKEKLIRPQTIIKWHKNLNKIQLQERMKMISRWNFKEKPYHTLIRQTKWKNFPQAIEFVNSLAAYSDKTKYFPDVYVYYNQVNIEIRSHLKTGELRDSDIAAARSIDGIIAWLKQTMEKRTPETMRTKQS